MFLHALQHVDLDYAVRKTDTEKLGFEFLEAFFIFDCLLLPLFYLLLFTLPEKFLVPAVVFGYETTKASGKRRTDLVGWGRTEEFVVIFLQVCRHI